MDWRDHIEQNPEIMVGKPVIKGTRLTVEIILSRLGAGATPADLVAAYPFLSEPAIRAAQTYAAECLAG
jgi:uncharacterized protein (DUF433 family)